MASEWLGSACIFLWVCKEDGVGFWEMVSVCETIEPWGLFLGRVRGGLGLGFTEWSEVLLLGVFSGLVRMGMGWVRVG